VVSLDEIPKLRDPLKDQLLEIAQSFGETLPAA
jgi:Mg-chelatase subunit ChlI